MSSLASVEGAWWGWEGPKSIGKQRGTGPRVRERWPQGRTKRLSQPLESSLPRSPNAHR